MRAHHQRCSRSQCPRARSKAHGNEHLQVTMNGLKGKLSQGGHTTVSTSRVTNFINHTKEKKLEIHGICKKATLTEKKNVALYWLGKYQTQAAVCAESLMRKWF